ncbi:MAG: exodeoxyribonuclease III [Candidatus Nanopelagicales bacterium]|nr:exodeoxyribonuclease III [Candidatus Nanopelagicales bacterium]
MTLHVVTANVNGIRAALKRGGLDWLAACGADVLCLQEVRATPGQVAEALGAGGLGAWHLALAEGQRSGHAGVALLSRTPLADVAVGPGPEEFADQGRWVEATVPDPDGGTPIRVASVYVHTGEADGPRHAEKDRFLAAMGTWMAAHADEPALVCGDLNVGHTHHDIKNWRGNRGRAGFLESERAHLDRWYADPPEGLGWVDLGRRFGGDGPGPYTWWSWRGRGFDTDGGWRIDAVLASPPVAQRAKDVVVHKAPTYAQRWSDHAAVSATFV